MKSDIIRKTFLEFFEKRKHVVMPSASLLPQNDPTLLFTGAGMNQFKDYYLDTKKIRNPNIATSQKCFRLTDIDNVGQTASHNTFFEMLGNFSFGGYFKKEAIKWAWELITEIFSIPKDSLWITIFKDDEEAFEIWSKEIGLPKEKILRLDEDTNFWNMGETGPCGPCSEIHLDRGEKIGCQKKDCGPACSCDRFLELWNLVFTQYDRKKNNKLTPLPQKNIDTGMGLERLASVLQSCSDSFETDLFWPIIKEVCRWQGIKYKDNKKALRVIADHARAVIFAISDGIYPSNKEQGHVLRKLIRKAVWHGRQINLKKPFLFKLTPVVAKIMETAYPEIKDKHTEISLAIKKEEEKFGKIFEEVVPKLKKEINESKKSGNKIFSGTLAFIFYDTWGVPLETIEGEVNKSGLKLNMSDFEKAMRDQREKSRKSSNISDDYYSVQGDDIPDYNTDFKGYNNKMLKTEIVDINDIGEGGRTQLASISYPKDKDKIFDIILKETPFYGESGGQAGDTGIIKSENGEIEIINTVKIDNTIIHKGKLKKGSFSPKDKVTAEIDKEKRDSIARNHTATHILHKVLRDKLGNLAKQSGSLVAPDRLRFDFTHFSAIPKKTLLSIEKEVNKKILENLSVKTEETDMDTAQKRGAMALFGEKYGKKVRLVDIDNYSLELCGGTHVKSSGEIGFFKILTESSIASGIRRIEAITGIKAYEKIQKDDEVISEISSMLSTSSEKAPEIIKNQKKEISELKKKIDSFTRKSLSSTADNIIKNKSEINKISIIIHREDGLDIKQIRELTDKIKDKLRTYIALIGSKKEDSAYLICRVNVTNKIKANEILKEIAPIIKGGGGGKPEMAQAGGKASENLDKALKKGEEIIKNIIR
jgi:alanyl-tRNA synthetase